MSTQGTLLVSQDLSRFVRRRPFEEIDRAFWIALLSAFFLEALLVFIQSRKPADVYSEKEIARIQERFATFVLERARMETPRTLPSQEGEGTVGGKDAGSQPALGGEKVGEGPRGGVSGMSTAEAVRQSRERIAQEVSGKGLLALLTGTGSSAQGEGVPGFEGGLGPSGGEGIGDYDEVLGRVEGLKTGGPGGVGGGDLGRARGGRVGKQATIDDLVAAREGISTEGMMTRRGDLVLDAPTDLKGGGSKSAYRSPEVIREVLLGHVKAIQYCYERELKRDPSLKGKITVRITVAPEGHVKHAEIVSTTMQNERVERCILSRIQLWNDFPPIDPSEGDVTFRQVYTFGY